MLIRPRRNRQSFAIRNLVAETPLLPSDLIAPFFILPGSGQREPIDSMPGIDRLSADLILIEAEKLHKQGVAAIGLFPIISQSEKDSEGSHALDPNGSLPRAIQLLKKELPSLCLIADVALDPYTSHGHDGLISPEGDILNDPTVSILAQMALILAEAGIDIVAPSDMMDGRVGAIRRALDAAKFQEVSILSYTAKYASSLYRPFRNALHSHLTFGDKKTYQMDPRNAREALLEASLDAAEGADILMVKPALFYLDIIARLHAHTHLPICAYHVSGEYSMVMAAHERNFADAPAVFLEALTSIKRAGACSIFTYATPLILPLLR